MKGMCACIGFLFSWFRPDLYGKDHLDILDFFLHLSPCQCLGRNLPARLKKKNKNRKKKSCVGRKSLAQLVFLFNFCFGTSTVLLAVCLRRVSVQLSAVGGVQYFQESSVKYVTNTFVNRAN